MSGKSVRGIGIFPVAILPGLRAEWRRIKALSMNRSDEKLCSYMEVHFSFSDIVCEIKTRFLHRKDEHNDDIHTTPQRAAPLARPSRRPGPGLEDRSTRRSSVGRRLRSLCLSVRPR